MTREELAARVEALLSSAMPFAKWHSERAAYGGSAREFHERAEVHIGYAAPELTCDLLAEVDRLRTELDAVRAAAVEACKNLRHAGSLGCTRDAPTCRSILVGASCNCYVRDLRARIGGGS